MDKIAETYPLENRYFEKSIASGGRFWARPPLGESRFDVCQRAKTVIDLILQDELYYGIDTVIVVSHGMTLRALAMLWLNRTPEWLENEPNPQNCSVRLLEGLHDGGYVFGGFAPKKHVVRSSSPVSSTHPTPPQLHNEERMFKGAEQEGGGEEEGEDDNNDDDEDDPVAYTQRAMTSVSSTATAAKHKLDLLKRLEVLEEELVAIREALRE